MPMLELTDDRVLELAKQLPPDWQRAAFLALAAGAEQRAGKRLPAERQLRRLSAKLGHDWDDMTKEEREAFLNDLMHEGDGA